MVCVSDAFVYEVVDVNKIIVISSIKLLSYVHTQETTGINHTFVDLPIHGEHLSKIPTF